MISRTTGLLKLWSGDNEREGLYLPNVLEDVIIFKIESLFLVFQIDEKKLRRD